MKKTVRINYVGTFPNLDITKNAIYIYLKENGYDVQITEDADYLVVDSVRQNPYPWVGKPQVRIMNTGENITPDFNLVDYGISIYPIQFGDRHFQLPGCTFSKDHWIALPKKSRDYDLDFLREKEYFANFIASHESESNIRGDFFKELCKYKRVESVGTYLNNMPDGQTVDWTNDSKTDFQRKCKFTLCFESTNHYGFVTEKIVDAFYSDTIPVYYGSPTVTDIFNKDAFINVADYPSFEAAIEKIRELDQDEEKYLEMLRQPILVDPEYPERLEKELYAFIGHIFEQPLEQAYRRSRVYHPQRIDTYLAAMVDPDTLTFKNLLLRLLRKIKEKVTGILQPGKKKTQS